jgi:hypothetical protein
MPVIAVFVMLLGLLGGGASPATQMSGHVVLPAYIPPPIGGGGPIPGQDSGTSEQGY